MNIDILQIGAFIGKDDVQKILETETYCTAILVEPVPWFYEQLIKNYKNIINPSRIFFENSVINNFDGMCNFHCIEDKKYAQNIFGMNINWFKELSSLKINMIEEHEKVLSHDGFDLKLEYKTLNLKSITSHTLIKKYNITSLQYLKIDAEGTDFQILMNWPFDMISPKYIQFESCHLDGYVNKNENVQKLAKFLNEKKYIFLKQDKLDMIFIKT